MKCGCFSQNHQVFCQNDDSSMDGADVQYENRPVFVINWSVCRGFGADRPVSHAVSLSRPAASCEPVSWHARFSFVTL